MGGGPVIKAKKLKSRKKIIANILVQPCRSRIAILISECCTFESELQPFVSINLYAGTLKFFRSHKFFVCPGKIPVEAKSIFAYLILILKI